MAVLTKSAEVTLSFGRVPERYRVASDPSGFVVAYRGESRGLEGGMSSKALHAGAYESLEYAKNTIEGGNEAEIEQIIDSHTSSSSSSSLFPYGSPFLSLSLNPEHAQVYATFEERTIYKLMIPANRGIFDFNNIGCAEEILVLGMLLPSEIVSIKLVNDLSHSELADTTAHGTEFVRRMPKRDSKTREVRDSKNWGAASLLRD